MKITDKMIEDFNDCILKTIDRITKKPVAILEKYLLKQKGYKVEEKKTALEEAREYTDYVISINHGPMKTTSKIKFLYEKAIEEIQQKPVIDDDIMRYLKDMSKDKFNGHEQNVNDASIAKRLLKQLGVNNENSSNTKN